MYVNSVHTFLIPICILYFHNSDYHKDDVNKKDLTRDDKSESRCRYEEIILDKLLNLDSAVQQMKREIDNLRNQVTETSEQMNESTAIPTIAFLAKDVTSASPTVGQQFLFQTILFNHGNGYDNKSGIFTAPIAGTYLFTVQFCINGNYALHYELISNGKELKRGFVQDSSTNCYTTNALAVLDAGAGVWVKLLHSSTSLYSSTYWWNSFSGSIIHK